MIHISEALDDFLSELRSNRDKEISMAAEVLPQYIQDHNNKAAWREVDRSVARLARAWDRMISLIEKTKTKAEAIETSCENFYGD